MLCMEDVEKAVYALAARQRNLISLSQLIECGMGERTSQRRVGDGSWTPLYRGVHLIGPGPPSWVQRAQAAVMAAGSGAALSHRAGGAHLALDGLNKGPIELTVPYERVVALPGVHHHRSTLLAPAEVQLIAGIPTARPERPLGDLRP